MMVAQALIATPIVAGLTLAAVSALDPRYRLQLLSLGAGRVQTAWWLLREAKLPLIAAVIAGIDVIETSFLLLVVGRGR